MPINPNDEILGGRPEVPTPVLPPVMPEEPKPDKPGNGRQDMPPVIQAQ